MLQEALERHSADPTNYEPILGVAVAYRLNEDSDAALEWIERGIAGNPDPFNFEHLKVAVFLTQKRYPEVVELARRLVAQKPDSDQLYFMLAEALFYEGFYEEAKKELLNAELYGSELTEVGELRAKIAFAEGDTKEADAALRSMRKQKDEYGLSDFKANLIANAQWRNEYGIPNLWDDDEREKLIAMVGSDSLLARMTQSLIRGWRTIIFKVCGVAILGLLLWSPFVGVIDSDKSLQAIFLGTTLVTMAVAIQVSGGKMALLLASLWAQGKLPKATSRLFQIANVTPLLTGAVSLMMVDVSIHSFRLAAGTVIGMCSVIVNSALAGEMSAMNAPPARWRGYAAIVFTLAVNGGMLYVLFRLVRGALRMESLL